MKELHAAQPENQHRAPLSPGLDGYVGITIDATQFSFARQRLKEQGVNDDPRVHLFCADAAAPETWDAASAARMKQLSGRTTIHSSAFTEKEGEGVDCWVLALDTLYHFRPSRSPIFRYARHELNASILAYDIVLSDDQPLLSRFLLALIGMAMGSGASTFKTEEGYRAELVAAGYRGDRIEFKDVSEHVFGPLTNFLAEREVVLKRFGWGLGKLRAAKWLFGWWAKSKAVRGVIVVAKTP
jgi:hypothetical protein